MKNIFCMTLAFLLAVAALPVRAQEEGETKDETEKAVNLLEQMPVLKKLLPSAVIVNYYFKLDSKGREPRLYGINVKNCLEEQRPFQTFGFVVAGDLVLTGNAMALPAYLEKITVEYNGKSVEASIDAFYPEQSAIRLKLSAPLEGTVPLQFKTDAKEIAYNFYLLKDGGLWTGGLRKFAPANITYNLENNEEMVGVPHSLLLDKEGNPVTIGYTTDGKIALEKCWQDDPAKWRAVPADDLYKAIAEAEEAIGENFYTVKIRMRRRQLQPNTREYYEEQRKPAELTVPGMLLQDGRVMLNVRMSAQEIARIERFVIMVNRKAVAAEFEVTFKDFGILLIKPESKLPGKGIEQVKGALADLTRQMLYGVEIRVDGDSLDFRTTPSFIRNFRDGWKNMLLPNMVPAGVGQYVFDMDKHLIAMPVQMRVTRSANNQSPTLLMPYAEIAALLARPDEAFDRQSVPQPQVDQDRLAWLGVEFQRMTSELAELKGVMTLTENGNTGLLVTYVYPGSPAAEAGLQVYDIITRVTPQATNIPIRLRGQEFDQNPRQTFPWSELDRVPEQFYERMPVPWQELDNRLNTVLTSLGFGEKFRLSYIHDGKMIEKVLTVTAAPTYLGNAEKYQDKELGLTVNDLTFEARHYFRLENDAPGVIITNIKTGSKASVAGLKPYEIIYSVNDVTVKNVEEFKKQVSGKSDLSFGVRRMNITRIAKIQANGEKAQP